jgi:hypothetical protein
MYGLVGRQIDGCRELRPGHALSRDAGRVWFGNALKFLAIS